MQPHSRSGSVALVLAAVAVASILLGIVAFARSDSDPRSARSHEPTTTPPTTSTADTTTTVPSPHPSGSSPAKSNPASTAGGDSADQSAGSESTASLVVTPDHRVRDLTTELPLSQDRSMEGAIGAFADYAAWLFSSPAAKAEPRLAGEAVGRGQLNEADSSQLAAMGRTESDVFRPELGVFRGLGHSGEATTPDQVMVEVLAPLTMGDRTRWTVVGGVISWSDDGWVLTSIQPHDPQDPELLEQNATENVLDAYLVDGHLPDGIGWLRFDTG